MQNGHYIEENKKELNYNCKISLNIWTDGDKINSS